MPTRPVKPIQNPAWGESKNFDASKVALLRLRSGPPGRLPGTAWGDPARPGPAGNCNIYLPCMLQLFRCLRQDPSRRVGEATSLPCRISLPQMLHSFAARSRPGSQPIAKPVQVYQCPGCCTLFRWGRTAVEQPCGIILPQMLHSVLDRMSRA